MIKACLNFFFVALCCAALCACGAKKAPRQGGTRGSQPYSVGGKTYYPLKSGAGFTEEGMASWYGPGFHGKPTASGEKFNQYALTAAHKTLPLGTMARVTHLGTGRSVIVKINDRGPFARDRIIDLSRGAAQRLDIIGPGRARVLVQSIDKASSTVQSGDFYIQTGAFGQRANAQRLIEDLTRKGFKGRLLFDGNKTWSVQIGPYGNSGQAQRHLESLKPQHPSAFIVASDKKSQS